MRSASDFEMGRYAALAGRYLKTQRKRTLLTILAVVLSVALITSAGVFSQSIRDLGVENVRAQFGSFYARLTGASSDDLDQVRLHAAVDEVGSMILAGTAPLTEELAVQAIAPDRAFIEGQGFALVAGRFPTTPSEIAVERWVFQAARRSVSLGDDIVLPLRLVAGSDDSNTPAGAAGRDEAVADAAVDHERTFTVVGLLDPAAGARSSRLSTAIITPEASVELYAAAGREPGYIIAFTTRDGLDPVDATQAVASSLGRNPDSLDRNTALLSALGEGSESMNQALRAVELIVAIILIVATVAVIYNTFTISVIERIRQFGILRTVGATPRQIRHIVFRQAGIIAALGAPLGLGAGLLAVRVVVLVFNGLSMDIGFAGVGMTYPPLVLIGAPVLGVFAVFISVFLPAFRAGRTSPLEAVLAEGRFVSDRVRNRRSPVLGKLFGIAGRLASQNVRRHPGRFAVTVFSIGIGVALFVTFSGFFRILTAAGSNVGRLDFSGDISVVMRGSEPLAPLTEEQRDGVASLPGVTDVAGVYEAAGAVALPREGFEGATDGVDEGVAEQARALAGTAGPVYPVSVYGVDDATLLAVRANVVEGWLPPEELTDLGGIYLPEGVYEPGDTAPFIIGGTLVRLPVAGIAEEVPTTDSGQPTLLTTIDVARQVAGQPGYTGLEVSVESTLSGEDLDGVIRAIEAVLGNRTDVFAFDMGSVSEQGDQVNLQMSILLYGLVAVVALIGALNIVNTITTNLLLRTREFGTLRAVGMSGIQMRGMIRIEAVLYGVWAVLLGGVAGLGLTRMLFNNVVQLQAIPWQLPWGALIGSIASAVTLCVAASAVPMKRIAAMNIVDSIRTGE